MEVVRLNIGGARHQIAKTTILQYPETFLARLINPENYLAQKDQEGYYFIDRNPKLSAFVLDFYRTGRIIYPTIVSKEDFEEELKFWNLYQEKPQLKLDQLFNSDQVKAHLKTYRARQGIHVNQGTEAAGIVDWLCTDITSTYNSGLHETWSLAPPREFLQFFSIKILKEESTSVVDRDDYYLLEYQGEQRRYQKTNLYLRRDSVRVISYSF